MSGWQLTQWQYWHHWLPSQGIPPANLIPLPLLWKTHLMSSPNIQACLLCIVAAFWWHLDVAQRAPDFLQLSFIVKFLDRVCCESGLIVQENTIFYSYCAITRTFSSIAYIKRQNNIRSFCVLYVFFSGARSINHEIWYLSFSLLALCFYLLVKK